MKGVMPGPVVSNSSVAACKASCICGTCYMGNVPGGGLQANEHPPGKGHTLAKHALEEPPSARERLDKRLADEPDVQAASSYDSKEQAEKAVASILRENREKINAWLKDPSAKKKIAVPGTFNGGKVRLRSARDGKTHTRTGNSATVIIVKDNSADGFHILTSYPQYTEKKKKP